MAFAMTPASGWPPEQPSDFPNYLQWQSGGVNLGGPDADTINIVGATATRGEGENANVVTIAIDGSGTTGFSWVDVPGDYEISNADINAGLSFSGTTGEQNVHLVADVGDDTIDVPDGTAVLIYQEGFAPVRVVPGDGVSLRYRAAFDALTAGQFSTLTLVKRRTSEWLLCGDLDVLTE